MVRIPFLVREEYRFLALLATILALMLVGPILGVEKEHPIGQAFFTLVLIAGVRVACVNRRILIVGVALAIPAMASYWLLFDLLPFSDESLFAAALKHAFPIVFFLFLSGSIFKKVITTQRVTANMIYGALCVYLLVGVTFAYACAMIDDLVWLMSDVNDRQYAYHISELHVGARKGDALDPLQNQLDLHMFLYYSFTTMTTLGYGDIIPTHPFSRVFSSIMAIIGQLYLAVFVARLVGTHIAHRMLADREAARQDE